MRAFRLYGIGIMESLHRLRHDLGRELVVGVSSLVLFATFLYVFNDFLNVQVAGLSVAMRDRFAQAATGAALLVAVAAAGRALRTELYGDSSLLRTARSLGEAPAVVRTYLALRCGTAVAVTHGVAWWAVERWLTKLELGTASVVEGAMLAATGVLASIGPRPGAASASSLAADRTSDRDLAGAPAALAGAPAATPQGRRETKPAVRALARWRLNLLRRNRLTRLCVFAAAAFVLLAAAAGYRGAPPFVAIAATFAAGYLIAAALCFQAAEDIPQVWIERGFGITHDQFVAAYEQLGWGFGLATGAAAALVYLLACAAGPGLTPAAAFAAAKLVAVAAIPAGAVAGLIFQVDPRRPAVNLLITFITGLFVGTAVFAHWLGLLLVPILRYYALRTQAGRFYRA